MAKTDVAEKQNTDISTDLSMDDIWSEYAGEGLDNVGETDVLIPRLTILQGLSPQLNKKKSEYIEGAGIGDICDVGVREFWSDGIMFLPVYFSKVYLEWGPRESGKGLIAIHEDPTVLERLTGINEKNVPVTVEGNTISETSQYFGFNLSAGGRKCFIPFSSTQLKKARAWNTLAMSDKKTNSKGQEFTPPLWYRAYALGTGPEGNAKGDWVGWTISRGPKFSDLGFPDPKEMFEKCKSFRDALVEGEMKADTRDLTDDQPHRESDDDAF